MGRNLFVSSREKVGSDPVSYVLPNGSDIPSSVGAVIAHIGYYTDEVRELEALDQDWTCTPPLPLPLPTTVTAIDTAP